MRSGIGSLMLGGMVLATASWVAAGYLESDFPDGKAPPATPAPGRIIPPPQPHPENEVAALLDRVTVHGPIRYRALTVFPLVVRADQPLHQVETLAAAMAGGRLTIHELDPPTVQRAIFVNRGEEFVFAIAGEVIQGGLQNRTIRHDVLIRPNSKLIVDLYCVEKGRWAGKHSRFEAAVGLAPNSVRQSSQAGLGQDEVWQQVAQAQKRLRVQNQNEDLAKVMGDARVSGPLAECRRYFEPRFPGRCVGMVVARGPRIVGAEVFADTALFGALRDRVLDSFAVDVIFRAEYGFGKDSRRMKMRIWRPPTAEDARRFLHRAYRADYRLGPAAGAGKLLRISGAIDGHALVWRGRCVHLSLVDRLHILPLDPQRRRQGP